MQIFFLIIAQGHAEMWRLLPVNKDEKTFKTHEVMTQMRIFVLMSFLYKKKLHEIFVAFLLICFLLQSNLNHFNIV